MSLRHLLAALALLFAAASPARTQTLWEARLAPLAPGVSAAMASPDHYADAVESLLQSFEAQVGRRR